MHHTHRTHTAHVHRTHTARRRLATGRRLLCTHLLRRSSLSRHQGTQPLGGLHTAHRGHATSRCGDAMYAGSPGILPAVGALHGLLLHSHLQVLLPRPHGNATHQGETHTHRTHLPPNNSSRAARIPHTYRRVRMRRTAAASAHTTRPPPPAQLLAIPSTRPPFSPPCAVWCRSSLRSGYGQSRRKNSSETPTSPQRGASTVREVGPRASNDQELQWPQRTFCGPSTASVLIKRIK